MAVRYLTRQESKKRLDRLRKEQPALFDKAMWQAAREDRERQQNRPPRPYKLNPQAK